MSIENKDGTILKDGEEIGTVVDGAFVPVDGLHHKTVKAVETFLAGEEKPEKAKQEVKEPEPNELGDLDHNLIRHRKKHWDEARFNEMYPEKRLAQINFTE